MAMEKEKWFSIGGLDESVHSFFEEIEIGAKCMDNEWHCLAIPRPIIAHLGSATWGTGGLKNKEREQRYNESSNLLQFKYFGKDWSLHEKFELFMMKHQPPENKPHGLFTFNSYYNEATDTKLTLRVPKLIFKNYFEEAGIEHTLLDTKGES
ncbi:hypothetical protein LCGC14_3164900 [marine sediment metagenome]|uniref:Uncharacterized protein n=1 Tax=marine sediment metagenome TaxID=412755 RepID=A0A0F8VN62_9ZZZZ